MQAEAKEAEQRADELENEAEEALLISEQLMQKLADMEDGASA